MNYEKQTIVFSMDTPFFPPPSFAWVPTLVSERKHPLSSMFKPGSHEVRPRPVVVVGAAPDVVGPTRPLRLPGATCPVT